MKKVLLVVGLLVGLVAIGALVYSAAPAANTTHNAAVSAIAVDSQHTCTVWNVIDSMIIAKTDTCDTYYSFIGTAVMDHDDVLYFGMSGNGYTVTVPAETLILYSPRINTGKDTVYFGCSYKDSLRSQTDASDTVIVFAASQGGTAMEEMTVSGTLIGSVINVDAE